MMISTRIFGFHCCLLSLCVACAGGPTQNSPQPPDPVLIENITPQKVLSGTYVQIRCSNITTNATHILILEGTITQPVSSYSQNVALQIPLVVEGTNASWEMTDQIFASLGTDGYFNGKTKIESTNDWGTTTGPYFQTNIEFAKQLTPVLLSVGSGVVYLNSLINITGDDLLLGGKEGYTVAEITRTSFVPSGEQSSCTPLSNTGIAEIILSPVAPGNRGQGVFLFVPSIVGICPGRFIGEMRLTNKHANGKNVSSINTVGVQFDLQPSRITGLGQDIVRFGEYLEIQGDGLAGGDFGNMVVRFEGTFIDLSGSSRGVTFDLFPDFVDTSNVRTPIDDSSGIGEVVKVRTDCEGPQERGVFKGSWTPKIIWQNSEYYGDSLENGQLRLEGVKQVIWVRFTDGWIDTLRLFGLQAADKRLRQRILEVMAEAYRGINVEFREESRPDFALYAILDIAGPDPNYASNLGYDNTTGKDRWNERLHDYVGGFNAGDQQSYPGYGGVFAENFLLFSEHPPAYMYPIASMQTPEFDEIFDPFRSDVGNELTGGELLNVPILYDTNSCPSDNRILQAACAIIVLGNMIGSTAAHELGHSFGLANPFCDGVYHNGDAGGVPDVPNRLMDGGGSRPFAERAELKGQGPAVFCQQEFEYLQTILPLPGNAPDPVAQRPSCDYSCNTIEYGDCF